MTKKAIIISTCAVLIVVAIITLLFSVVFRVRKIEVLVAEDFEYIQHIDSIVELSGIEKGDSVFAFNRESIKNKIEAEYPYARVEAISVVGLSEVNIRLSNREGFYYINENNKYYLLDEDCKVLHVTTDSDKISRYIDVSSIFNIGQEVKSGDFIKQENSDICINLYKALYTNATLNIGQDANGNGKLEEKHLDRADMLNVISNIEINKVQDLSGAISELVIKTNSSSYGVTIKIVAPNKNLDKKINMAFSALRLLVEDDLENGTDLAKTNVIYINDINGKITNMYKVK